MHSATNAFLSFLEISPYYTSEKHLPFFTGTAYCQLTVILWSTREFRSLSSWWFLTDELSAYSRVFVLLVRVTDLVLCAIGFHLTSIPVDLKAVRFFHCDIQTLLLTKDVSWHQCYQSFCALVRSLIKIQPLPYWNVSKLDQEKLLPYCRLIVPFLHTPVTTLFSQSFAHITYLLWQPPASPALPVLLVLFAPWVWCLISEYLPFVWCQRCKGGLLCSFADVSWHLISKSVSYCVSDNSFWVYRSEPLWNCARRREQKWDRLPGGTAALYPLRQSSETEHGHWNEQKCMTQLWRKKRVE